MVRKNTFIVLYYKKSAYRWTHAVQALLFKANCPDINWNLENSCLWNCQRNKHDFSKSGPDWIWLFV